MANAKTDTVLESGVQLFNEVTETMKTQTRQFWLAGLGVYAKAGKDSMDYFKTLVAEGEVLEKQGKELFSEQAENANEKLAELKSRFEDLTGGRFQQVSKTLEERRADFLSRFGIPKGNEIEALNAKLDEVSKSLKKA
ncbi:phasin family protein [Halopseudomonas sp.]|jgi:poly(hydroxyalkanoate) granule-associated protein|uniref:phasin family protein n=1 Tax=Halopseudomonas sp. TaxID=2901191 RepID=UPI00300398DF|tara:strand:+ start:1636 stop:2049 length:414 start_codon:yes stop_codon:yes gene_type:complete